LENDENNFAESRISAQSVINKYASIKNLAQNEIFTALNNLKNNQRYSFQFIDEEVEKNLEIGEKYFKIIIKNRISKVENFFSITYDMRDFTIKTKPINPENNPEVEENNSVNNLENGEYKFTMSKFSKTKFRNFFFGYLEEIISADTQRKLSKNNFP
jgi:hypothetical protein